MWVLLPGMEGVVDSSPRRWCILWSIVLAVSILPIAEVGPLLVGHRRAARLYDPLAMLGEAPTGSAGVSVAKAWAELHRGLRTRRVLREVHLLAAHRSVRLGRSRSRAGVPSLHARSMPRPLVPPMLEAFA